METFEGGGRQQAGLEERHGCGNYEVIVIKFGDLLVRVDKGLGEKKTLTSPLLRLNRH